MSNDDKNRTLDLSGKPQQKRLHFGLIALVILGALVAIFVIISWNALNGNPTPQFSIIIEDVLSDPDQSNGYASEWDSNVSAQDVLYVHMIDCGQGDSFLFEQDGQYAMVDCGTRSSKERVSKYLKEHGVEKLQFVIGTHPHDDHLGGMAKLIGDYNFLQVYMPNVNNAYVTSNWYINLRKLIKEEKLPATSLQTDQEFFLGKAKFRVLTQWTPEQANDNLNNYSTVVKVSFGEMDILMTGDAESTVEKQLLSSKKEELQCEILKVGHHGSTSSTSDEFLKAVNPEYALISAGVGNKYNHPMEKTMQKLEMAGVKCYRTDECGDVVVAILPNSISFDKEPGDYRDGPTLAKEGNK